MKKNNRQGGYSLVELLLTMAIFSVIMLGVVVIMRSTSVTFNRGTYEVDVQAEAQRVVNQVENILIDADLNVTSTTNKYTVNTNAGTYTIQYRPSEKELYLSSPIDSNETLLGNYIEDFSISSVGDADNRAIINLTMDKKGYNYTLKKEVYYRNIIEDTTSKDKWILGNGGSETEGEENQSPFDMKCVVDRYSIVDLQSEYHMVSDWDWIVPSGVDVKACPYTFASYDETNHKFIESSTPTQYVKCKDSGLNVNFELECSEQTGWGIQGNVEVVEESGNVSTSLKKMNLSTPKVDLNNYSGAFVLEDSSGIDNAHPTYIGTKGLNVAEFIKQKGVGNVKFDVVYYYEGSTDDQKYTSGNDTMKASATDQTVAIYNGEMQNHQVQFSSDPGWYMVNVSATPEWNGFIIYEGKNDINSLMTNSTFVSKLNQGKVRLSFTFEFSGVNNTGWSKTSDIYVITPECKLGSFKSNVY